MFSKGFSAEVFEHLVESQEIAALEKGQGFEAERGPGGESFLDFWEDGFGLRHFSCGQIGMAKAEEQSRRLGEPRVEANEEGEGLFPPGFQAQG